VAAVAPLDVENAMAPISAPPLVVAIPEAARRLGIGRSTVWALIARGSLPVVRIGGRTLVRVNDLDAFVERSVDRATA